ncbi:unnamed protein product [Euphydryas editha]|uniref:Uncharacterized protein n=1 Tax=Euphydryas editha TaxID=104508 RepID=A0AAU9TV69_EUPED|nr:unnamed protein product [Euphydryas editha]
MSINSNKIKELKLKLKSATKLKLKNERNEYLLRSAELALSEEMSLIRKEMEITSQKLEDVKQQISQMNCQTTMIKICSESEKSKVECYSVHINNYKNDFDALFTKEHELFQIRQKELEEKEAEKMELERQKHAKALEINEQKAKEATVIEDECERIEQECNILRKRNKAVMLQLRRKLIDAEETRRTLMMKTKI